ncbi:Peptidyl-prolyl cis-trans isomerase cyp15 [Coemansia sp. Benny D115]|nr:Peptidyl-prolyl cis-trans isomerase cyp15 [Coemansia sp. Benny D115]
MSNKRTHVSEESLSNQVSDSRASRRKVEASGDTNKQAIAMNSQEDMCLERLPCAKMYERSYMHRESVDFATTTATGFIITMSADGHVKFWKKQDKGIEFVKDFRAHLGAIVAYAVSIDGQMFATVSTDKKIKVFDVVNFDMIGIISIDCAPSMLCWVSDPLDRSNCIAVADSEQPKVLIYDPYESATPKRVISSIHRQPITLMAYNPLYECMVSIDKDGMVEFWSLLEPGKLPSSVDFVLKSQTDLYEFKKSKSTPTSLTLSPNMELFVCTDTASSTIWIFRFATGKLQQKYDESVDASNSLQQSDKSGMFRLDDMEFGRRLAVENELRRAPSGRYTNAVFDESSRYLLFSSLFGIKVVDLAANKVVRVLGKSETLRFTHIALAQSVRRGSGGHLEIAASANPAAVFSDPDPTLICAAFKRNRFYLFTRNEPDHSEEGADRDIFNEKPTREEASLAVAPAKRRVARAAVLRTTLGDIQLTLFPELAPKAVENFVTHAQNGYYNGVIFHRVIKRFMIQTGDPLGNGTGGESIWGRNFEDEFTPQLRHDRPYTLSMANAGRCTNGSQFFITTIDSAPWLDDKHTIFGRATGGADVIHSIESSKTDKNDKPFEDVSIMNIQIKFD